VAVDAKKAVEIVAAAKKEGKRIKDEFEAKLVGENLVGFKELKEIIHERVGHKDGHIGKRVARLKELYNDLKGDAFEQSQGRLVLPEIADKKP
ncbi:MAG: hypothetical protein FWG66_14670, partial [Spirochaetes bacterium]|nr:hypothetical protein [Spirochaetota bacterium]